MRDIIPNLCIIVPCYNEEEVLCETGEILLKKIEELEKIKKIGEKSRILFVNDGSTDNTWGKIKELSVQNKKIFGISQSRNRGHQKAVFAGLMEVKDIFDITISIDCDGQDDAEAMNEMLECYLNGNEIVYGVRKNRKTDSILKKIPAEVFYKILNFFGAEVIYNHADYRLVSCRVLKELEKYKEVNIFLRGLFPLIGFKSTKVYYDRKRRITGKSKYSISKMLLLASDGIIGLSLRPLHFIFISGVIIFILSCLFIFFILYKYFFLNQITAYSVMSLSVLVLLGGIQLISVGIIGEYIGKIYEEIKKRPLYIISERTE